jgi:hypothetical protein
MAEGLGGVLGGIMYPGHKSHWHESNKTSRADKTEAAKRKRKGYHSADSRVVIS